MNHGDTERTRALTFRGDFPSPPSRGEREGPSAERWEGEVGVGARSGIPHLTPALSAPRGGEGEDQRPDHPNTSEKGKNSTIPPGTSSLRPSSRTAKPSDCTIEERMPAPSFGYLRATMAPSSRSRVA